jgi:nucleotide-binding universal stress UspA family protein
MDMSGEMLVLLIVGAWVVIGLTLAVVMGRRGHDRFRWLVVGAVLGPLAIVLAIDSSRYAEWMRPEIVAEGDQRPGLAVLIGFDGSSHAHNAVQRIAMLGPNLGRLTIARVVPFDAATDDMNEARAQLEEARGSIPADLGVTPALEIIEGQPAAALESVALRDEYDLIAVGTRGSGMATRVLGSTADKLAHVTSVPVLILGDAPPPATRRVRRAGDLTSVVV